MKVLNWLLALLGLWEFGDLAALWVRDFGPIPPFLWNHILVGLVLMITGIGAARTREAGTARRLDWIAAGAGLWLGVSSFLLRQPAADAGLWNDLIVGGLACLLGGWAALRARA